MDPLHELVERAAQHRELIFALHGQTSGQVAFALGNVLHGTPHGGQRTHQHLNQQAQQQRDGRDRDKHRNQRRSAELAQRRIGLVLVDRQTDVPLGARQAGNRCERENTILPVQLDVLDTFANAHRRIGINILEVLHHLVLVRADDHLTVTADQESMADATEVHRIDDFHQGIQAQVTAHHTQQLTVFFHRQGNSHHQPANGSRIGRGQHGFIGGHRLFVPRALTRVVAVGHFCVGALGEDTVGLAHVGELEIRCQRRLVDQPRQIGGSPLVCDVLRQVFQHQDATAHPVLDAAGRQVTGLFDGGLKAAADGVSLQIVVVEGEQGKSQNYHTRGG